MSSLSDHHFNTQPLPLYAGDNCKDKEFDHILGGTFPFMDTEPFDDVLETQTMNFEDETQVLFEDGSETQVMNFEGETQVLFEDGLETQVMNFADETQVLDNFDGFDNMDTQLLNEWNNEETDKTDMFCDIDEKSEKEKVVCSSPDRENTTISKQDDYAELEALFYKQTSAGMKLDFTSLRVAGLRASGLAARKKALAQNVGDICSSFKDESPKENHTPNATDIRPPLIHAAEIDQDALEEEQVKEIEEESKGRIGISAVRRLSMDDVKLVENEALNSNYQFEVKSNDLVGLSYVDSQEPGDFSQTNALAFVDKFIKSSNSDFAKAFDIVGPTVEKSKSASSIKGIQNLARKNGLKCISGEIGIYDWDDNREDEGGGEFYSRQKNVFFDKDGNNIAAKVHYSKRTAKKAKVVKKNLSKELDEQLIVDSLNGMKATCTEKGLDDMLNAGPDTQIAAEAMEGLCFGLNNGITEHTPKGSCMDEKEDKKLPKRYSLRKRCVSSSCEDLTRKSKQQKINATNLNRESFTSSKQSKSTRKQHKDFDTSNVVKPIASRTRQRSVTRQSLGGNVTFDTTIGMSHGKRRRSHGGQSDNGHGPATQFAVQQRNAKPNEISNRSKSNSQRFPLDQGVKRLTRSSLRVTTVLPSLDKEFERDFFNQSGDKEKLEDGNPKLKLIDGERLKLDVLPGERNKFSVLRSIAPAGQIAGQQRNEKPCEISYKSESNHQSSSSKQISKRLTRSSFRVATVFPSTDKEFERDFCNQSGNKEESKEGNLEFKLKDGEIMKSEVSPGEKSKSSGVAASPICMGDDYLKQSCRRRLSNSIVVKEIAPNVSHIPEPTSTMKESRRREMSHVRVMFSHHLDDDLIKHQKKILAKLGISAAPSSIREATHFVTDKFVPTRNMLEAIAFGKPIVTHLWLESCGQANCFVDEKNYVPRDADNEKEFGFILPASLVHARQHPLLKGLKVWITPNTKPGVEILSSLVKAVHGLPVKRIGRSVLKGDKIPSDLIVLSCKEDYAACVPFIKKGGAVFGSELLLNGIVSQKLDFGRHRLFDDHVKKTRSTIWLKQDNHQVSLGCQVQVG